MDQLLAKHTKIAQRLVNERGGQLLDICRVYRYVIQRLQEKETPLV